MKLNLLKSMPFLLFTMMLFCVGQVNGQGNESKPGTKTKTMSDETAKPANKKLKGVYTKDAECVDLYVRSGCLNYIVFAPGDKASDIALVKVCADAKSATKPVNICRRGAKKISVKYEKLDENTDFEFREIKAQSESR